MLREVGRKGGIGVYVENLLPELLRQGGSHEWVLLYKSPDQKGRFRLSERATEKVLPAVSNVWWDQVRVPGYVERCEIDVVFNTKFAVPLRLKDTPVVMAVHGAGWFVTPECYPWWDVKFNELAMPIYSRSASHIISNSACTTRDYVELVGVPEDKITTAPLAPAEIFAPVTDEEVLSHARRRYGLPQDFFLSVTAPEPRKNLPRMLEAFARCRSRGKTKLVIVGVERERLRAEVPELMAELDGDVIVPGWVEQADLPSLYSLATLFFFPSLYEEFGIPNCEAMACGTPILTSKTGAPPDVVGDAGLLVDPTDAEAMAQELDRVAEDPSLRRELSRRGLERSERYSWRKTAARTLDVLESAA